MICVCMNSPAAPNYMRLSRVWFDDLLTLSLSSGAPVPAESQLHCIQQVILQSAQIKLSNEQH